MARHGLLPDVVTEVQLPGVCGVFAVHHRTEDEDVEGVGEEAGPGEEAGAGAGAGAEGAKGQGEAGGGLAADGGAGELGEEGEGEGAGAEGEGEGKGVVEVQGDKVEGKAVEAARTKAAEPRQHAFLLVSLAGGAGGQGRTMVLRAGETLQDISSRWVSWGVNVLGCGCRMVVIVPCAWHCKMPMPPPCTPPGGSHSLWLLLSALRTTTIPTTQNADCGVSVRMRTLSLPSPVPHTHAPPASTPPSTPTSPGCDFILDQPTLAAGNLFHNAVVVQVGCCCGWWCGWCGRVGCGQGSAPRFAERQAGGVRGALRGCHLVAAGSCTPGAVLQSTGQPYGTVRCTMYGHVRASLHDCPP